MRYNFTIPVGDWSDDGHGKCDEYPATANKPIKDVREAYFTAQKLYPALDPAKFCCDFEDSSIPDEIVEAYKNINVSISKDFDSREMAKLVVSYINLADPELDITLEDSAPMLVFYGSDKKKRHIEGFGYGLFY